MSPDLWEKVSTILDELLDLTQVQREQLLKKLRSEDPSLCEEVESLLEQHQSTDLFESPPADLMAQVHSTEIGIGRTGSRAGNGALSYERAGRFVIRAEIARGGMGAILRADDPDFQRSLAIKILLPGARRDPESERRFLREARITGRLQHPGIPPIHELGRLEDGTPFFAMKLIEGRTLAAMVADTGFTKADAKFIGIFEQICRTLAYAHSQGIIHRDLKPSNVMVGAFGEVQVMDWGLAKELKDPIDGKEPKQTPTACSELSRAGDVSGTPAYMAPEQARGEIDRLDERCDVFGLGGILCAMLTRQPPFLGDASQKVLASAQGELGPTLARLAVCGEDDELIAMATKCLAAQPNERYQNAGEVADAVTRFRESAQEKLKAAEMDREKALVKIAEERRRRRVLAVFAGFIMLTIASAGGAALWYQFEWSKVEQERVLHSSETAAQKKYLEKEIAEALDRAEQLGNDLHAKLADPRQVAGLLSKLEDWQKILDAAAASLERIKALAGGSTVPLDSDLLARSDRLAADLAADRQDFQVAWELDGVRMEAAVLLPSELNRTTLDAEAGRRYAEIFRKRGLDLNGDNPSDHARLIKGMRLRFVLVSALDHWAITTLLSQDKVQQAKLTAIARLVDPDPWRDQVRDPVNWKKGKLANLVRNAEVGQLSPQFIGMVGQLMFDVESSVEPFMRQALAHYPADYWLQFSAGWHGVSLKNLGKADKSILRNSLACYQAAMAIRPNSKAAYFHLGWVLDETGDQVGAAAYYERAIALFPNDAWSHVNLGRLLAAKRQFKDAIRHFQTAIDLDPKYALAHSLLGKELTDAGEFDRAIARLEIAIKYDPNNAATHNNLGVALRAKNQLERAEIAFKKSLELDPSQAGTHNNLGLILHGRNDLDGALRCYEKATELNPQQAQTYVNIGIILQDKGRIADSYRAFQTGHALGMKLRGWPVWVGERVKELKHPAELDERLGDILAKNVKPKGAPELIDLAGFCVKWKKSNATAVELYRRAFAKDATLAVAHRVDAAGTALLAAADISVNVEERSKLRGEARAWLEGQLGVLAKNRDERSRKELERWRMAATFASVRDLKNLAKLPQNERQAWQQFWAQVDKTIQSLPVP